MTLTLVDPSSAPVVNHPGGIISVRCADYVGPARGTLSTVSDSLAAAGTAVKEEQTLAVATTFTGNGVSTRWASAANSVVIPLGDLNREARFWYLPFISYRVTGNPPSNAIARSSWLSYDVLNGANLAMAFGIGSSFYQSVDWIAGARVPHYTLMDFRNQFVANTETDAEEFVIRAWGITGGNVAIYLETVYFIPSNQVTPVEYAHQQFFPGDYILALFNNGVVWRDIDNDASDLPDGFGKYSTMRWEAPWAPSSENWGPIVEFQEADNEPSSYDAYAFGDLDNPGFFPDPIRGRLSFPVGATYIPAVTLLTDDFSSEQNVHVTYGAHYVSKVGDYTRELGLGAHSLVQEFWTGPGISRRGTFVIAGEGKATTYFGTTIVNSGHTLPGEGTELGFYGWIAYGGSNNEGGFAASESSTDPRLAERRFGPHLESFIASCRCAVDTTGNGGHMVGMRYDNVAQGLVGAHLKFTSGGNVELSLVQRVATTSFTPDWIDFDSPVNIGSYAPNDWFWIKVEKRGYWWRARAWKDGDPEPSTWNVEGAQPYQFGAGGFVEYPWDDTWPGDLAHDNADFDPRGGFTGPAHENGHVYTLIYWQSNQGQARAYTDDFTIEWNPGGSSPKDIHMKLEKYDGTVNWGSVTIPYGAHRFVRTDQDVYNFDADTHGFTVRLWKEPGSPDLQTAGMGRMFMRIPLTVKDIAVYEFVPLT